MLILFSHGITRNYSAWPTWQIAPLRIVQESIPIPKDIFNEDYPVDPKTFGERLGKAKMDSGLLIKDMADLVGVTEDTVINWEIRGRRPWRKDVRDKVDMFLCTGNILMSVKW